MSDQRLSKEDQAFQRDFETGKISTEAFDHRAHVRLAYAYLVENDAETAVALMREALLEFVKRHSIEPSRYHETMTRSWILAVRHFMELSSAARDSDQFIESNPRLLDYKIMLEHYSADLLFSPEARARFVDPDLEQIPRYPD